MAHIRKLPSGKWNAVVRHPSGRRVTKTDPLKRVVVTWAQETEAAFRNGSSVAERGHRLTVQRWHDQWLRARAVEKSTARKDESRLRNHVLPYWGDWHLGSVTRLDVQTWIKTMGDNGIKPTAIHGAYEIFAVLMAGAVENEMLTATPCRKIALPRLVKREPRWLTVEEYERIQMALADATTVLGGRQEVPDPNAPVWQAMVGLACYSGLRPGELAGLDVSAIDFDRHLVRVSQVLTRSGLRAYPKTDHSARNVPFPPQVGEMLWRITADRTSGPVFTAPRGGRIEFEGNFRTRVWNRALLGAGIEPVRFYVCRHTCASWLVQKGVSDRRIMQILGHANNHLIATYAHLAPDAHDEIRAAWGESPRPTADPRTPVDVPADW